MVFYWNAFTGELNIPRASVGILKVTANSFTGKQDRCLAVWLNKMLIQTEANCSWAGDSTKTDCLKVYRAKCLVSKGNVRGLRPQLESLEWRGVPLGGQAVKPAWLSRSCELRGRFKWWPRPPWSTFLVKPLTLTPAFYLLLDRSDSPLGSFNPVVAAEPAQMVLSPLHSASESLKSAFSAIWRSGWRRRSRMIYSAVTFSPEGLHNSSYFRGSVAARSDI